MLKSILNNKLLVIGFHVALGVILTLPILPTIYGLLVIGLGCFYIILNKNRNEEALLMAAYLVGGEVFLRMTRGFILYETGKFGVMLFLFLGAYVGKNSSKPNLAYIFYLLLLLLGIVFTSVPEGESIRKAISFNLTGPFLVGISAMYFFQRKIKLTTLYEALYMMTLPVIAMTSYLYFRTPDLSEIVFRGVANFQTSGGFGPNQVATILGLGIFTLGVFILSKKSFTGYMLLDILIFAYMIYRGLLTFSRGGIVTGAFCLVVFAIFYIVSKDKVAVNFLKIFGIGAISLIAIWLYTSNVTGGMLINRYTGKNARGVQKKDITTGRLDIFGEQLNSLVQNPVFGIGVGNGKFKRQLGIKKVTAASHNEIGRLLEEHGMIGIFSLIILFIIPTTIFYRITAFERAFLSAFFFLWLLTIGHSAMRIAFPAFIYGLCLIKIVKDE